MSYWVYLQDKKGEKLTVGFHDAEGGIYKLGGSVDAELNITYNYSPYYYQQIDKKNGLRWLDGKKAEDCAKRLERAVKALGTEQNDDYWKPTAGNAGYALSVLLAWAKECPDGIFIIH